MRWGNYTMRFIRPIRWLVSLWNEEVLPCTLEMVSASSFTKGHRFLSSERININHAQYYETILEEHFVIAKYERRKQIILKQIHELEASEPCTLEYDEKLLEEVTNLVEFPNLVKGTFDKAFLKLPREVLVTTMSVHQRYFAVCEATTSTLLPHFITITNSNDTALENIRQGNEKVLKARLKDAQFFYQEDQKQPFSTFIQKAERAIFFQERGTQKQRIERLKDLSTKIAKKLNYDSKLLPTLHKIAELSKLDLFTKMVDEFPELQGIMGAEYSRLQGEPPEVCRAVREHYYPRFTQDGLPQDAITFPIALADKLDNLTVAFSLNIVPKGVADPYGLRRAAQGVIQLLLSLKQPLTLQQLVQNCFKIVTRTTTFEVGYSKNHRSDHFISVTTFALAFARTRISFRPHPCCFSH